MNVEFNTNHGLIVLELNTQKAPVTCENFLKYVNSGYYDGTIFHRTINGFMIQGGGFTTGMQRKDAQAPIQNEANNGLKNDAYTLAMARTNTPHSGADQFFINAVDNDFLNFKSESPSGWGYAVFGKVVSGFDVVDKIAKVKTVRAGFHDDVPAEPVIILSAKIVD